MKIFSNFDTEIRRRTYQEHLNQYGVGNVLCFGRSKLYWFLKIFFPMVFLTVGYFGVLYLFYYLLDGDYFWYIFLVDTILMIFFIIPIIGKYFDYKLDFIIVTPDFLIMYNQT
ncbi:TPA: hypothetical protein DEP21_05400 [Patescibacteria group bacterium]|nr:hypothetical protein [Candidatus Gracilibacteria bacterium]